MREGIRELIYRILPFLPFSVVMLVLAFIEDETIYVDVNVDRGRGMYWASIVIHTTSRKTELTDAVSKLRDALTRMGFTTIIDRTYPFRIVIMENVGSRIQIPGKRDIMRIKREMGVRAWIEYSRYKMPVARFYERYF